VRDEAPPQGSAGGEHGGRRAQRSAARTPPERRRLPRCPHRERCTRGRDGGEGRRATRKDPPAEPIPRLHRHRSFCRRVPRARGRRPPGTTPAPLVSWGRLRGSRPGRSSAARWHCVRKPSRLRRVGCPPTRHPRRSSAGRRSGRGQNPVRSRAATPGRWCSRTTSGHVEAMRPFPARPDGRASPARRQLARLWLTG
jgi:hypothetical protein